MRFKICCRPARKACVYDPHFLTKDRLDCNEDGYEEEDGGTENRKEAAGTGGQGASLKEGLDCLDIQHQFKTCSIHKSACV